MISIALSIGMRKDIEPHSIGFKHTHTKTEHTIFYTLTHHTRWISAATETRKVLFEECLWYDVKMDEYGMMVVVMNLLLFFLQAALLFWSSLFDGERLINSNGSAIFNDNVFLWLVTGISLGFFDFPDNILENKDNKNVSFVSI